jgi:hypothetical protein
LQSKGNCRFLGAPLVARNDTKNRLNGICFADECHLMRNLLNAIELLRRQLMAQDDESCL